jgi:hypothetical protein
MSNSVSGLPLAGQFGVALTSMVLERNWGKSLPSFPLWVRVLLTAVGGAAEPARGCSPLAGVLLFVGSALMAVTAFSFCCCRAAFEPGLRDD